MTTRAWIAGLLGLGLVAGIVPARAANDIATGSQSGLPIPRFVSLKADRVNVRGGPAKNHDVTWVFTRGGLPVEITAEYENWRRIRDWEGSEGWVYHSLLSGRRTAIIAGVKGGGDIIPVYETNDPHSRVTAHLETGVLGTVKHCSGTWCRIVGDGFDGWIQQERLWGVYPDEKLD